jgi:cellulose 1,4-beta-cellobiosidase
MDLWEANSISTAYTPHVCSANGQIRCSGTECGDGDLRYSGICDKDGCDFNSYRQGDKGFYGPGLTVDTKKKFTVVTQFVTKDGTDTGALSEIRRLYVQNGVVIKNSVNKVAGIPATDAISDDFCAKQKTAFGDNNHFAALGGLATMGGALSRGMVLSLSLWDDHAVNMLWLDSTFPVTADPAKPGVARGTCSTSSGVPSELELNSPDSSVVYSNIKFGAIGSTYGNLPVPGSSSVAGTPSSTKTSTTLKTSTVAPTTIKTSTVAPTTIKTSATPSASSVGVSKKYEQCGGEQWKGPTVCEAGSTCTRASQYYSQCL